MVIGDINLKTTNTQYNFVNPCLRAKYFFHRIEG